MCRWRVLLGIILTVGLVGSARPAAAQTVLMNTDGASSVNNGRASSLGYTVSTDGVAGIAGMSQAALSGFNMIWINPNLSSSGYSSLRTAVAPGGALAQYVSNGGTLVLNVAGGKGNQLDIAPGGVDYVNWAGGSAAHESESFAAPSHAYLTGAGYGGSVLSPADFNAWGATDNGHLASIVPGSQTVLTNTHGPSWVQYSHGSGNVIVNTLNYGWALGGSGAPLNNLLMYSVHISESPAVPEPSAALLFLPALAAVGVLKRRRS